MVSSPYKTIDEEKVQNVGVREIKNIQHQLNYSNKVLSSLSKAMEKIERPTPTLISKKDHPKLPKIDPNRPIFQPNTFKVGKKKKKKSHKMY